MGGTDSVTTKEIPKPVFVNHLRSPGIKAQIGGTVQKPTCTGPPGYRTQAGRIDSSVSIPGLLKRLQIRALKEKYQKRKEYRQLFKNKR